ncbi:hypothetical protein WL42_12510 [Burkholderia ubonensis]|nr:hypothetical protein WL42_12510 [Burkholderia ubonensis]
MDDDDYYPRDKISYAVGELMNHEATFSGCDQIYIWYSHINKIYKTAAWGRNHALNGTFAYHRRFLTNHRHDDAATLAEETQFLNGFTARVLQLDPRRSILCVSHSANTYDKDFVLASSERTDLTLEDFVHDAYLLAHLKRLSHAPVSQRIEWRFFDRIVVLHRTGSQERLAQFLDLLGELGCDPTSISVHSPQSQHDAADHLAIATLARAEGWRNYLLLDDRVSFVRKENVAGTLNRTFHALGSIDWQVFLLGAHYFHGRALATLPGVIRLNAAEQAVAYAVNASYYAAWIAHLEANLVAQESYPDEKNARVDRMWVKPMREGCWLSIYPSFAYRGERENGLDLTAGFFRKIDTTPTTSKHDHD